MKRSNVQCPVCGQLNEGVDLEETEGWVECSKCSAVFMAPGYLKQYLCKGVHFENLSGHASDATKA